MFRFHWDNYFPRMRIPDSSSSPTRWAHVIRKKWGARTSISRVISPQLSIYRAVYRDHITPFIGIAGPPLGGGFLDKPFLTDSRTPMALCHGTRKQNLVGGWTNPSEKICSSNWSIFPGRGENQKCLKPPPRNTQNSKILKFWLSIMSLWWSKWWVLHVISKHLPDLKTTKTKPQP